MPLPPQIRTELLGLLEAAVDAKQAEQDIDLSVRFTLGTRTVKARVVRNSIDHPKGFVLYVTWKPEQV